MAVNNKITSDTSPFEEAAAAVSNALNGSFTQSDNADQAGPAVSLTPKSFFISWNSVLVLLFDGFPPALEQFKLQLNNQCSVSGYKTENFGSQWAKITLAFVNDSSDVKPLSLDEFRKLKQICVKSSAWFAREDCNIPVINVSLVEYEWRSLEQAKQKYDFELTSSAAAGGGGGLGLGVSAEQQAKSNSVFSEWDNEEAYLPNVNAVGAPYRSPLETNGLTCVSFLDVRSVPVLWQAICMLKDDIEAEFPGRYEWMRDDSLHCTIRAMDK
ncbi:hypothetical protein ACHAXN_011699 [Cyclotella atomus]